MKSKEEKPKVIKKEVKEMGTDPIHWVLEKEYTLIEKLSGEH